MSAPLGSAESLEPDRDGASVVIMGGGPGGATLGCYLSMAGIDNLIIERDFFPRAHVGESMVTSTTRIFNDIGFLETMEKAGFPRKYGASWHPAERIAEFDIAFSEFPQPGVTQDYTYHVDRSRFDLLLLQRAEALGSRVAQGVSAKEVVFDGSRAVGVMADWNGEAVKLDAAVVVDATGRDTLLGRQLRWKGTDPIFNQFAVHAWFEDVDRGDGKTRDYIHIHFLPVERGWAWQIPITETVTSIGVVTEQEVFRKSKHDKSAFFHELVNSNMNLAKAMSPARQCNEFKSEGNYSYSLEQFAGDGFVIVGDAGRFVDPIFSSGVNVAMHGAKFASEVIKQALDSQDVSRGTFTPFEARMKNGVRIWYDFIRLYYKLLPGFTRFIQDDRYRIDVLRLLQGDVYDRGSAPVLDAMRAFIESVEADPHHLLHGALSDVPLD